MSHAGGLGAGDGNSLVHNDSTIMQYLSWADVNQHNKIHTRLCEFKNDTFVHMRCEKEIGFNCPFATSNFSVRLLTTAVVREERGGYKPCLKLLHRRMYFIIVLNFCNRLIAPKFQ